MEARYLPHELDPKAYPPGTSVRDVFREAGDWDSGRLLILGEPGGGKTTMLLELAHALAEEARENRRGVPVYVPLSAAAAARHAGRDRRAQ